MLDFWLGLSRYLTNKRQIKTSPVFLRNVIYFLRQKFYWKSDKDFEDFSVLRTRHIFNAAQQGVGLVQVLGSKKIQDDSVSLYTQGLRTAFKY